MDLILIDTSVWINFFKGTETTSSLYLKRNLSNILIATCPVIVQEVLQGIANDKDFEQVKTNFSNFINLSANNPYTMAIQSANLYRKLRKKGVTIRKPNDCLITSYAINNSIPLLHDDQDFFNIAKHTDLKILTFS
jgi:predicted nucleic acid-binding protein